MPYTKQTWVDQDTRYPLSAARMNVLEQAAYDLSFGHHARRAHEALTGGGIISVTASYGVKWTQRFIPISTGRGADQFASGYASFTFPADGTVIPGVAGAVDQTVTGGIITLANWEAIYAVITPGMAFTDITYRIASYQADGQIPDNWVPICNRNNDQGFVKFATGHILKPGQSANADSILPEADAWTAPTFENGWVNYNAEYNQAGYMKDQTGRVWLRGLVKGGSAIPTTIFTLPAGYRPAYRQLFATISNSAIGRCDVSAVGAVTAQIGNAAWFSLDGLSFNTV